jgi:hypothetical protein
MVDRILHRTVGKTAPAQRSLARFGWERQTGNRSAPVRLGRRQGSRYGIT